MHNHWQILKHILFSDFYPNWKKFSEGRNFIDVLKQSRGTAVAQWLRCCATNRKVAGSIPDGVIGIFHWHKILPIALWRWSRLSLKQKWVLRIFPGGKGGRCVRLKTLPPFWAIVTKSGNLNFLEPSGHLGPVMGLIYLYVECINCNKIFLNFKYRMC